MSKISVIVATYNWPQALRLSLESLKTQSDRNFEVIIADDGSRSDTRELIDTIRADFPVPIEHVWIEDDGCRKTVVGNLAIAASHGDYLVFIDGDCIVQTRSPKKFCHGRIGVLSVSNAMHLPTVCAVASINYYRCW